MWEPQFEIEPPPEEYVRICLIAILVETDDEDDERIQKILDANDGGIPDDMKLSEMGHEEPLGHGVYLELKEKIEDHFHFKFVPTEVPGFFESGETAFGQLVEVVTKKWDPTNK